MACLEKTKVHNLTKFFKKRKCGFDKYSKNHFIFELKEEEYQYDIRNAIANENNNNASL